MAMGQEYRCDKCGFSVTAWEDGNPYVLDNDGKRNFFYHPGEQGKIDTVILKDCGRVLQGTEREEYLKGRFGNEGEYLCADCGHVSRIDEKVDEFVCESCGKPKLTDVCRLEGKTCPKCGAGKFRFDPDSVMIS